MKEVVNELARWKYMTAEQLKDLLNISSLRTTYRILYRLQKERYVERIRPLLHYPGVFLATSKGIRFYGIECRFSKIKPSQLKHDLLVIDVARMFKHNGIDLVEMTTEKELRRSYALRNGLSASRHYPDFEIMQDGHRECVEVELTVKDSARFFKNVEENFMNYDGQTWFVPTYPSKISRRLKQSQETYPNISIINLKEIQNG